MESDLCAEDLMPGDAVELLGVPGWLIHDLPKQDQREILSFIGKCSVVDEIDKFGYYWVSFTASCYEDGEGAHCSGHSFCLTRDFLRKMPKESEGSAAVQ